MQLYDWQLPIAQAAYTSLSRHGVVANGSEMGTGKTVITCEVARRLGRPLFVVCLKSSCIDWRETARAFGVSCTAINYEKLRTGKTEFGRWVVEGRVWEWNIPADAVLVFDEAHVCGAAPQRRKVKGEWTTVTTLNALMLVAAVRQHIPMMLLSGTLLPSPLKAYAIGYALGLHNLIGFWRWAEERGVTEGEHHNKIWSVTKRYGEEVMTELRAGLGDKFVRIRKADVPGFPECQNIPIFLETAEDMPELDSDYGVEARAAVELLKVPGIVEKARELVEEEGMSVAIFVNFRATLAALQEAFPKAGVVCGGQSAEERAIVINRFQENHPDAAVILLMTQAGGTGISLHDKNGRPRASIVSPGHNAIELQQVLGRIHRAGSLSPAINFLAFAYGVPVERRIRANIEAKLRNLAALNDADLLNPSYARRSEPPIPVHPDDTRGTTPENRGVAPATDSRDTDQCAPDGSTRRTDCGPRNQGSAPAEGRSLDTAAARPLEPMSQLPIACVNKSGADAPVTVIESNQQHSERKHARCSPSKLKNLAICPSYKGDDDAPPHPITLRGTAMHEALERDDDTPLLDDDERRWVGMCREFLAPEIAACEEDIREIHLKTHDEDVQGFVDRLLVGRLRPDGHRTIYIRDYKMGANPVESPDNNPQAIAYTVAAFLRWEDCDEVDFAFLIPRLDMVLQHTFKREELPRLMLVLSAIADRVRQLDGKEFRLDFDNCLYCGAKANCPAMLNRVLAIGHNVAPEDRLPLPQVLVPDQLTKPQEIAWVLDAATVAEKWAEQARRFALRAREAYGEEIPGYDYIERRAKREIENPVAAWAVAQEFGVTQEEYMASATVKITTLEASVKAHAANGSKDAVAKQFTDRLLDAGALSRGAPYHVLQRSRKKPKTPLIAAPQAAPVAGISNNP